MTHRLLTLVLTLSLTTAPPTLTYAQDSTSSESVTVNGEQLAEIVDRACGEARALADEADGLRRQRDTIREQRDQCIGAMAQWRDVDAQRIVYAQQLAVVERDRDERLRKIWVVLGVAAGLVLGGVGGWVVGQL